MEASVDSVEAPAEEAMEAPVGETVDAELEIEEAIDEEKAEEKVEETVEELIESVAGKAPAEEAMETPVGETVDAEAQIVEEMAEETELEETREVAPVIVTVYATALLENSERSEVSSDDIESISRILKSKDHLCRNVGNVSFRLIRSERLRSGYFEHQVETKMIVNQSNLWEPARSYLYHHLGRDTWTLRDNTNISIRRIHVKR